MFASPGWDADFAKSPIHGEDAQRQIFRQVLPFLKDRRLALDVGAHIGIWTAFLSRAFQRVVAFEPVCENFEFLLANVQAPNVASYGIAIGAEAGTCRMTLPEARDNSGCWFMQPGQEVIVSTLDSFKYLEVDDRMIVDLIKIDVEGQEGAVLMGARHLLDEEQPVVIFEDKGLGLKNIGERWINPKDLLKKHGYMCRAKLRRDEIWSV